MNHDNVVITNKIKSIKYLKISINSLFSLWNHLKDIEHFKFLFTRRLNQDCLENFFANIRQQNGNCVNPSPVQFERTFKKIITLNLFHSGTENCADIDPILLRLSKIPLEIQPENLPEATTEAFQTYKISTGTKMKIFYKLIL